MAHLASLLDGVKLGVERFRPNIVLGTNAEVTAAGTINVGDTLTLPG